MPRLPGVVAGQRGDGTEVGQMSGSVAWPPDVDEVLRRQYDPSVRGMGQVLADELGLAIHNVRARARDLGLTRTKEPRWTERDRATLGTFLRIGWSDAAIGSFLGRSESAIHIKRIRWNMGSRRTFMLNMSAAARALGIPCAKTIRFWIDRGYLPARDGQGAGGHARELWVDRLELVKFLADPEYWPLWNPDRVRDPALREFVKGRRDGKNDSYLTVGQIAERFHVVRDAPNTWIRAGLLPAKKRGNNWIVKESDLAGFVPPTDNPPYFRRWKFQEERRLLELAGDKRRTWTSIGRVLDRRPMACFIRWQKIRNRQWQPPKIVDVPIELIYAGQN